ncbi:MAG: Holliday junction resolvase RuvX [Chloroherpetonaceae bacterium]|nr:Holliday junction resolvase RuvX [Chloroherpetonaceae bacterium]MCS7211417.1 Holliday junction resolvase RuvX [Chloroherpetonaceae bacterium]MDW8018841.1 Holliday junction resolvase RuvX [Chloroherpetonaceae bacterium]MDW8466714.1 Holliday junction resolvase RuvX [Chloroherpetonaceae bacterium]
MTTIKKRILAIDYGTRRIGLAKSDPFWLFAQPVGTFSEPELYHTLHTFLAQDGIEKILVGYPTHHDGSPHPMKTVVDAFIERLKTRFPLVPIERVDEFGSSKAAMKVLIESGVRRKARQVKGRIDQAAAALLLQAYLDSQPSKQA